MRRHRVVLSLVVGIAACLSLQRVANADQVRVALVVAEVAADLPGLRGRLRSAITASLRGERLDVVDLADTHKFVLFAQPAAAVASYLAPQAVRYMMGAVIDPAGDAGRRIRVLISRVESESAPQWGPWVLQTTCSPCTETDLVEAAALLAGRGWKAMQAAEQPSSRMKILPKDRRDKGARLLKRARSSDIPTTDKVTLVKAAIRAGAGAPAFALLAEQFLEDGNLRDAEEYALKAASIGARNNFLLGKIYFMSGRWEEARESLRLAAEEKSSEENARHLLVTLEKQAASSKDTLSLAQEAFRRGRETEAERLALAAFHGGMGSRTDVALLLAKVSMKRDRPGDALVCYTFVLARDPTNLEATEGRRAAAGALQAQETQRSSR